MNNQERQALIEHIQTDLDMLRNVTLKFCDEWEREGIERDIQAQEIALAALTENWHERAEAAEAESAKWKEETIKAHEESEIVLEKLAELSESHSQVVEARDMYKRLVLNRAAPPAPFVVRLPGKGGVESTSERSIRDWADGWEAYREEAIKAIKAAGGSVAE